NYCRTGKLHLPEDMCVLAFHDDLAYWGIDEILMETCCHIKYQEKAERAMQELRKENGEEEEKEKDEIPSDAAEKQAEIDAAFGSGLYWCPSVRKRLWTALEDPMSSFVAKVMAIVSMGFVIVSSVDLILNT